MIERLYQLIFLRHEQVLTFTSFLDFTVDVKMNYGMYSMAMRKKKQFFPVTCKKLYHLICASPQDKLITKRCIHYLLIFKLYNVIDKS